MNLNESYWRMEFPRIPDTEGAFNGTLDTTLGKRESHPFTTTGIIFIGIPIASIILVIVFGNALVIIAVLRDFQLKRQAQNWLIVSLAVADLLVGLLIMPLTLTYELLDDWILGRTLCELWLALDVLFVTASILNLCAISLDRFGSLTYPTTYPQSRTPTRMLVMIVVVWLSAFVISFPPLVGWRPEKHSDNECMLSDQLGYVLYSAFGSFYIPVVVLLFVYARIYFISRKRKRRSPKISNSSGGTKHRSTLLISRMRRFFAPRTITVRRLERKTTHDESIDSNDGLLKSSSLLTNGMLQNDASLAYETTYAASIARVRALITEREKREPDQDDQELSDHVITAPEISSDGLSHVMAIAFAAAAHSRQEHVSESLSARSYELQKQLRQRRKLVRRRERQATVVLGFVLGSFVFSWLPFFCSYLLSAICCRTPDLIFDVIFWLGYCNSALNPFIYNFFNRDFRRAFRRILCANRSCLRIFSTSKMKSRKQNCVTQIATINGKCLDKMDQEM